jgi:hypothetical protein
VLFEPGRHEPLHARAWDEARARDSIARIVAEAERVFDPEKLWPVHPLDGSGASELAKLSLYQGAPGVIWAIDHLTEQGVVQRLRDWAPPGATRATPRCSSLPALRARFWSALSLVIRHRHARRSLDRAHGRGRV